MRLKRMLYLITSTFIFENSRFWEDFTKIVQSFSRDKKRNSHLEWLTIRYRKNIWKIPSTWTNGRMIVLQWWTMRIIRGEENEKYTFSMNLLQWNRFIGNDKSKNSVGEEIPDSKHLHGLETTDDNKSKNSTDVG